MKMKRVLKIIGIIIAILIILFLIHTIRNYVIVTGLQNKIKPYFNSSNYYMKSVTTSNDGTTVTMDYYKKDNKQVAFLERNLNGEISKISIYNNGERIDRFFNNKEDKIAELDSDMAMTVNLYNGLESESKWQTFLSCISANIKSVNYNGKECYSIKGFMSLTSLNSEDSETIIDKNTGLLVKLTFGEEQSEKEYKFDNVDDSIFTEPDISEYTLKDKE